MFEHCLNSTFQIYNYSTFTPIIKLKPDIYLRMQYGFSLNPKRKTIKKKRFGFPIQIYFKNPNHNDTSALQEKKMSLHQKRENIAN